MKKIIALLLTVLLITATLTACGGGGSNHALVGTWEWEILANYEWTFNADGTGTRGTAIDNNDFEWETDGDGLTVSFVGGIGDLGVQHERWTYEVSGNTLTVTSRVTGETFSYIRAR